uniref:EF hand calcium binding domain containing protein n=1 Tax=Echinococcus granulosus TaxID=6210 RepID=A0A068WFS6_ECHGR|nr:EF hand calcium binding domain containing protein [Echinococcus granulosus]
MIDPELENIDAKIFEAFDLFDHERNKTVDSRELGTIVRSLGLCPSEADLVKLTAKVWIFSEHNSIPSISSFRITTKLAVYCPV